VYALVVPWLLVCLYGPKHGLRYYVGLALLGLGLAWLARRSPRAWLRATPVRIADMLCFNLLVVLLTVEVVLRLWIATGSAPAWISTTPDAVRYRLNPAHEYFGSHPNSRGFHDEEWAPAPAPGTRRVAVLGDSFTVGMVPLAENYVTLADEALGPQVDLLNLGVVHTAVPEYVQILRNEALSLGPELVVLGFYIGNDVHENTATGLFTSSGSKALQAAHVLWRLARSGEVYGQVTGADAMYGEALDGSRVELPLMTGQEHLEREWKHLDALFRDPPDRRTRRAWRDTEDAIREFVATCREAGLPVVATIAPDEIQVVPELFDRVVRANGADPRAFDLEVPDRRLAALFAALDVPVLDFLPVLRAAQAGGDTYHLRAVHWNRRGNAAAAEAFGPWLLRQLEPPADR
jgi:hypothetical protein